MDVRWRRDRRGGVIHAYPATSIIDVALCGTSACGPFCNEFPAPPAPLAHSRHCRRCQSALGRHS